MKNKIGEYAPGGPALCTAMCLANVRVATKPPMVEFLARMKGKRFYCNALTGNSEYNISINCDMTVSCNCQNDNGDGYLGDFKENSFSEIFGGKIAMDFRKKLARGVLPISECAFCEDLHITDRSKADHYVENYSLPKRGIMMENTMACNLKCLICLWKPTLRERKQKLLSLDDVKKISLLVKDLGIQRLSFFKYGEPFLSPRVYEELEIIRSDNPDVSIVISTNGRVIDTDRKREAALKSDFIMVSIFGDSEERVRKYQRPGGFEKAYENMKELVRYRNSHGKNKPVIEWKYVLFNWNDKREFILRAIEMAKAARVDMITIWPTRMPYNGISWRYHTDPFFKSLGEKSWKGREIKLLYDDEDVVQVGER